MPVLMQQGLVVAGHGRHVLVETRDGGRVICHPRGKKGQAVVGDRVEWLPSQDEGTVERVMPRRNLFYRQDEIRTKAFAANLDQVLILLAAQPEFSESQLARALIAAQAYGIAPLIGLNKSDLAVPFAQSWQRLQPYTDMGYAVLPLAVVPSQANATPPDPVLPALPLALTQALQGKTTLLLGPSGAGKSSLINRLVPGAQAATHEISRALQAGRHTTTSTRWYWVDSQHSTALIDSPGFQEFGLNHLDPMQLAPCMPDIHAHAKACKFHNCTHLHEPGCGVLAALASTPSPISPTRHRIYAELFAQASQARYGGR